MIKKCLITFLFLITLPFLLFAQDSKPTSSALTFEVLNESLKTSKEPQSIKILINCNGSQDIQTVTFKMSQLKALWSVLSVKLNDQSLWLIKSESSADNSNVLAWDYNPQGSELMLFPNRWTTPYTLELEIQLNLKDISESQIETNEIIIMEAVMAGRAYQCSPAGRGNQLSLQ